MRTINGRFLLVSAGMVAALGGGAYLLHEIQLRRSPGILLELGTKKVQEGRPDLALGYFSRYVQLAPHNSDAQILTADTLADVGRVDAAIKAYEQALLRDASRHQARRRLIELSIAIHNFPVAKSHLVDFLIPYTPDDPQVYYLLGICHEGLGEYAEAVQRFNEAINRDSSLVDAYARLATLLRDQRKNPEDADAAMERMVAANPKSAAAYIARADYRAEYRIVGVDEDVRRAVELDPQNPDILFQAARRSLELAVENKDRSDQLDDAEKLLQKGLEMQPRYSGWYLGLAQVDRSRGNINKAVARLEEGLVAVPNDGDLQWNLADLMIQQDRVEEGLGIAARLRDQAYPKVPLEYLVALADARRNKFVDASERWNAIRGQMEDWPELARQTEYWLGVCYERLGEYGLQLTAFRNAVKIDPAWVPARQWLANALARTGRVEEAITEYKELAQLTGVPGTVYRELARLLVLQELQRSEQARNWAPVLSFLDRAAQVDKETDEYIILRAEIQAAQGDRVTAAKTLQQAVREFPDSVAAHLALISLEQSEERWDSAEKMLDAVQTQFGDSGQVRLGRIRYLVQRYGLESFEQLQSLEQQKFEGDSQAQQQWRTSLAAAYFSIGKFAEAQRLWQAAIDEEPDNIRLRMFLFDLALSDGNDAQMQTLLADIQRIERTDERPLWHYGEATRLVVLARKGDKSALANAEQLVEKVRAARPTWSRIPLLQAEIDEIRGEHDKVVEHYLEAIDLGERSPTIIRRVVDLLYRQRRYAEVDSVLRRFEATQLPITGELGRLAADVAFRVQDFNRAMNIAANSIGDSDAYADLVWMGQLNSVMGERKLAEDKFRLAVKKEPSTPDAWIALVQHFMRVDSPDRARRAIAALAKSVDPKSVAFVEAICFRTLNDLPAASAKFEEAASRAEAEPVVLRAAADFYLSQGVADSGQEVLERLLTHADASPEDTQWARRNVAMIWVASNDPTKLEQALESINKNLEVDPESSDDRRAKAICLQTLGGTTNLEDALAIVEELNQGTKPSPADQLLAHQLCVSLGRKPEARRYLEQHTFENSQQPQNLARYIRFLVVNDEPREAMVWINRLEQLCVAGLSSPEAKQEAGRAQLRQFVIVATGFRAQLLLTRSDHAAAAQQITRRIDAGLKSPLSISPSEAVQLTAGLAQQFEASDKSKADAFRSAAEQTLIEGAKDSADQAIAVIMWQVQQKRLADAVKAWQVYFHESRADDFALIAAALAAQSEIDPSDLAALTERVQSLPEDKRSTNVLAGLVQLLSFQNRHAEAIAVQREILEESPKDPGAMNNLACYLALSGEGSEEALRLIDAAIAIAGPSASLLDSRGMILLELNRPEDAHRDLEQAVAMAPTASTYLHLAAACQRLNRTEQSQAALTQARRAGINGTGLHPLERSRYRDLLAQAAF